MNEVESGQGAGEGEAQVELPRLRRNLSFHFLWTSTFASGFADRLAMLAVMVMLGYSVVRDEIPNAMSDAQILAGIDFFFFLPYVVWGPIAGWLADRLPRKWMMFACDMGRSGMILLAFFLLEEGQSGFIPEVYGTWFTLGGVAVPHFWKIWGLMFAVGMLAATFSPARTSAIPNVVGYEWLQRANAVILGMGVIGNLIGYIIGGPIAAESLRWCILGSSISYGLLGLVWPFLKTPAKAQRGEKLVTGKKKTGVLSGLYEIAEGAIYSARHKPVLVLALAYMLFWGGSAIVMAAVAVVAVDLYGGGIQRYTFVAGAFGFGMLGGAMLLGFLNARRGGETLITASFFGVAIFLTLLVIVPNFYAGMIIALLAGVSGGVLMITISTMLQQFAPDVYRGRVIAFRDMIADIGKVGLSLIIWRLPSEQADPLMVPFGLALAATCFAAGVFGVFHYVIRGPYPKWSQNLIYRIGLIYLQGLHRLRWHGRANLPSEGPVILAANHSSGLDPIALQACVPRHVRYLMARNQRVWFMEWFWKAWEPIHVQPGTGDTVEVREAAKVLKDGGVVGIFPEQGINPDRDELEEFGEGLGMLARRGKATVVPVWIEGMPDAASVYGAYFKPSHTEITFGEPIAWDEVPDDFESEGDLNDRQRLTAYVRQRMEQLRGEVRGEG